MAYDRDNHIGSIEEFMSEQQRKGEMIDKRLINNAMYALCELGMLGNIDGLDTADAIKIWAMVEIIRQKCSFPDNLRM